MLNIPRVALYARFSSDNQRTESIDAQIRAMKAYCQQQHWQIVATYVDEAKSATSDKRPDFQRMIADSAKNLFDIVLVHKLDRFSRDRYDSAIYKSRLKRNKVSIASVLERIDDSPESVIMESMLEGMAEYYSKNLSREVRKGLNENALRCVSTGGRPPLGYDLDEQRHLVVNEHEAEAVKAIFEMFAAGHGYSEIISWLNDHGYTTKSGGMFVKNGLFSILENEKYVGTYVYNRAVPRKFKSAAYKGKWKPDEEIIRIPGGCPAIISQELFDKVQNIKAANKRRAGRYYSKEFYLLTGIVFCGICGRRYQGNMRLSGKSKCRFAAYRCETHRAKCGNKEMNKDYLDAYIISLLREKLFNARAMRSCVAKLNRYIEQYNSGFDEQYEVRKKRLDELSQSLANITAAIEKGIITDSIIQRAEVLESERNEIALDLDSMHRLNPVTFEQYSYLIDDFRRLPRESSEFREFVQTYIRKITVFPYRTEIVLNTGFDVADLTETIEIRRGDLYALFERKEVS